MGRPKKGVVMWILVVAAGFIVAQSAIAAIPSSDGVIHGCVSNSGNLRVIDAEAGQACRSNEASLAWNQQGLQGPPGQSGIANLKTIAQPMNPMDPGEVGVVISGCPAGYQVISGGWTPGDSEFGGVHPDDDWVNGQIADFKVEVIFDAPFPWFHDYPEGDAGTPTQWGVMLRNVGAEVLFANVYKVCARMGA
jgi:hypothetical protein